MAQLFRVGLLPLSSCAADTSRLDDSQKYIRGNITTNRSDRPGLERDENSGSRLRPVLSLAFYRLPGHEGGFAYLKQQPLVLG